MTDYSKFIFSSIRSAPIDRSEEMTALMKEVKTHFDILLTKGVSDFDEAYRQLYDEGKIPICLDKEKVFIGLMELESYGKTNVKPLPLRRNIDYKTPTSKTFLVYDLPIVDEIKPSDSEEDKYYDTMSDTMSDIIEAYGVGLPGAGFKK